MPFLNGKPLNVNVACAFGGLGMVDKIYSGLVVLKNNRGTGRWEAEFMKNGN